MLLTGCLIHIFHGMSELQNASRLVGIQILVRVAHRLRDVPRRET